MVSKPKLALHGGLFSGKTALADALRREGFKYVSYTDTLKVLAREALAAVGVEVTVEEIKANKEKFRSFLIELGHLVDFDNGWGLEEIGQLAASQDDPVVLDNVRFPAQMEILAKHGFRLVRITTPMDTRFQRARAKGLDDLDFYTRTTDSSEEPLPHFPGEIELVVDGPMGDVLRDLFAKIAEAELNDRRQIAA